MNRLEERMLHYAQSTRTYVTAFCMRHKFLLIALIQFLAITVVVPTAMAYAWWPNYIATTLIVTVSLGSLAVIGRYVQKKVERAKVAGLRKKEARLNEKIAQQERKNSIPTRKQLKHAKEVAIATEKRNKLITVIERPSKFAQIHSGLHLGEANNHCYVDQVDHWVVAVKLFFNPFSQRDDFTWAKKDRPRSLNFMMDCVKLAIYAWVFGWFIFIAASVLSVVMPGLKIRYDISAIAWVALGSMILWTLAWGSYAIYLWRQKRLIIAEHLYTVVMRRFPFEDVTAPVAAFSNLLTIQLVQTFWGVIFGYGHFILDTMESKESIRTIHFVKWPKRVEAIFDHQGRTRGAKFNSQANSD